LKLLPHCNFRDILCIDYKSLQYYFIIVHNLATEELDTADAALHILDLPTFQVFIPQHYLTLKQDLSLVYLLLPTKESYYLDKAIGRLKTDKDETSQKSLIYLLWATVTKPGDEAIAAFINDPSQPKNLRSYAKQLRLYGAIPSISSIFSSDTYDTLKEKRRKVMHRVSDEALHDYNSITRKLTEIQMNRHSIC
jgi:hypothetical protein